MNQENVGRPIMKRPYVFHPVLFAIFPTVFLFFYNLGHVTASQALLPAGLTLLLMVGIWFGSQIFYRNPVKSGLATSWFLVLFFSYGHVFGALSDDLTLFTRYLSLLLVWPALFMIGARWINGTNRQLLPFSNWLNILGIILIGLSILPSDIIAAPTWHGPKDPFATLTAHGETDDLPKPDRLPDIYYIMLDGYAGQDVLQRVFHHDNTGFLNALREKNFYVAEQGQANYCQTWLSLTASLNLNYVDSLLDTKLIVPDDRTPLRNMIQHNWVIKFLKNYGYTFVSFESGKAFTDMETADLVLPQKPVVDEFLITLLRSTPILGLFYVAKELAGERTIPLPSTAYQAHRDRVTYALQHVSTLSNRSSPLFVFAHLLAPHPPFVFGPKGESIEPEREYWSGDGSTFYAQGGTVEEYRHNYKGQVQYLNAKLLTTVQEILDRSPEPPVIILQADHGSRMMLDWKDPHKSDLEEAFSIFSALYLPGVEYHSDFNTISPVNTFRLIFNAYFGTTFPILKNKSYYSTWERPYQFVDVSDQVFATYNE